MIANKYVFFALAVPCCIGPNQAQQTKTNSKVVVPGFRVEISYSAKATLDLRRRGESVVIFGYPFGFPNKGAPRNIISDMGEIGLGDLHAEIKPGEVANIPNLTLDQDKLRFLTPAGVQVLINVVSGRKSSRDNLLNCGIYEGSLQPIQSRTLPIHCKLIGE